MRVIADDPRPGGHLAAILIYQVFSNLLKSPGIRVFQPDTAFYFIPTSKIDTYARRPRDTFAIYIIHQIMVISPFAFGLLRAAKIPVGYSDLILPINYYLKKMNHKFCKVFVRYI